MVKIRITGFFLALGIFSLSIAGAAHASNDCPEFPNVIWWKTNHQEIVSYVSLKHGGKWSAYLEKWDNQLNKMKKLHAQGGTAVFKSKGLRLEGDMLLKYINAISVRVSISRCLARSEMANAGNRKNATASDG